MKNREIKFRVWDEKNKRMVYDARHYTFHNKESDDLIVMIPCYPFDPKYPEAIELLKNPPIMQFTGLKDKNEKEIYESDIVAIKYVGGKKINEIMIQGTVKWGVYNIGCNGNEYDFYVNGLYVEDEFLYHEMIRGDVEIIGNIYENPNLIK